MFRFLQTESDRGQDLASVKPVSTREKILEAAERCLERFGVQKTTLADVAEEAGVARMTVYRQFADREALFVDTSLFILERRWAEIAGEIETIEDPAKWILEALLVNLRKIEKDAEQGRYQQRDTRGEGMAIALSPAGLECIAVWLRPLLANGKHIAARKNLADDIAEWMHWQSYIMDSRRSDRLKTGRQWRRWLRPQIAGLVGEEVHGK